MSLPSSPSRPPASVVLSGLGAYAPRRVMTNEELSRMVDTSDEWIRTRTGIGERRLADSAEATSDLAVPAARQAMERAGVLPEDIDLVIVATITPDMLFPSTACLVQAKLGLRHVPAFDIEAACSGFIYALEVGSALVRQGNYRHALVIGAEKMSGIVDWHDRTTCVLFGDGAGAAILSRSDEPGVGLLGCELHADGRETNILYLPGGGSATPPTHESLDAGLHTLKMQGKEVFKVAVRMMEQSALSILGQHGLEPKQLNWVVPHQANSRIIDFLIERLQLPRERVPGNLERYGNTSAASIPLVFEELWSSGRLQRGDYILLVAFGAGLTWASALLKWH